MNLLLVLALAAAPPTRIAGDSQPLIPIEARGEAHGRHSVVMKVAIAADGMVEKVTILRASAAKMGEFLADYVKKKWRFMTPKNDAGKATRVEYLQAFNYELAEPSAVPVSVVPVSVEPTSVAKVAPVEPEPEVEESLVVRNQEPASSGDDVVADLPTAGAMKLQKQVLIDPQVLKVLIDSKPAFLSCSEKEGGGNEGVVKTSFVIAGSGAVARAHVRSSTLEDSKVEHCVLSTLSKLMFPKPRRGEPMLVLYPIVFK